MADGTVMSFSNLLAERQRDVLEHWLRGAAAGGDFQSLEASLLHQHGERLLRALMQASARGRSDDIDAADFAAVRDVLGDMSIAFTRAGITPGATGSFILSLTHAVLATVPLAGVDIGQVIAASRLVDRIALYTYELFVRAREDVIARQQDELAELSISVIRIWDDVLVLPIVGVLDSARALLLTERLLEAIAQTGSRYAILDITGVPTVDTSTAQHLIKTVRAVQLMGGDCVVSGLRPAIASTIVNLGVDMTGIVTRYSLADALRHCLDGLRFKVTRRTDD